MRLIAKKKKKNEFKRENFTVKLFSLKTII